ncbi:MAG: glycoside hydrolase family 16 protein [Deltaproteobacteria bacterium]|nr:glycoside hydrolase family 16 protein [Deltaproteobacteria bacterium]
MHAGIRHRPFWRFAPLFLVCAGFGRCAEDPQSQTTQDAGTPQWTLTWSDEFDGAAGTVPDASKWTHDVGGSGWGNNQLEYDTAEARNAQLDGNGHLAITAIEEPYGGRDYSSARINTGNKFSQAHGRFEARIKLPPGRGLWPAFWLLGADIAQNPWPSCGELDIMEYRGQETTLIHGSAHGPGYSGGQAITASHGLPGGAGFDQDFHVFAVEWTTDRVDFRVDDTVYETVTPSTLPAGKQWVFEHPFFVILNLAVGGNYVGSPDSSTRFPATMLVDYVRVYESAQ